MASIYKRSDSKWYWIRYKTKDGQWKSKATRYRTDNTLHRARAAQEAAELSIHEHEKRTNDLSWVDRLIETHQVATNTRIYYRNSWRNLIRFMSDRSIAIEDFTPATAHEYIAWRTTNPRSGGGFVGRNQALQDVKILKWIHRQGRLLGHMSSMAMVDFRSRKSPVHRKPVFAEDDVARCREALASRFVPDWMRTSFEIAYHTGCRMKETRIPLSCIDLEASTMTFPEPKGGSGRSYTIPIPDGLLPLFAKLKATPRSHTFEWPGAGTKVSCYWRRFFNLVGLKKHSFHGLRATRVTNLRRAGIVQAVAMRLVNHSSTLVHELYQRHSVEDLRNYVNAGLGSSKPQTPAETLTRARLEIPPQKTRSEPGNTLSRTLPTVPAD
ncbi:MAG: hypothetical protein EBU96_05165 [Actinobacteria bacterium]|nr:hypothetical protein [Actinomycetota bacterium]